MKYSYNWLQSFFEPPSRKASEGQVKKLPEPVKLAEILTMHSFEVEEVSKRGNDYILDIDILPNRASDCLSHLGIAREIGALTKIFNFQFSIFNKFSNKKFSNTEELLQVKVDSALCPRYSAYVIEGIEIKESPDWIKERLESMGQKAINNVVDITNYIMWELGQPLHAFDFDKIRGGAMKIRMSRTGESLKTLDGATHNLGADSIIIEDSERIIDLAGIKGGANTQIDKNTKKIVFQAAIFDPTHIRRTSQELNIRTDASIRYMHGFDPELPPYALERAAEILEASNSEASIIQKIDIYPDPAKPKKIKLDIDYANNLLGTKLSRKEIEGILSSLSFKLQASSFMIPSYRLDINIQEDLVEEIGRIYGYENIKPDPPQGILKIPVRNEHIFWRSTARQILAGFGFSEVYNYSFIGGNQLSIVNCQLSVPELANPISDEFRYLRPLLLPGILKNIESNYKYFENIKIFEVGKIFVDNAERENIIIALTDSKNTETSWGFYEIKGYIDGFIKKLGITDFYYDPVLPEDDKRGHTFLLHPGRRTSIFINKNFAGFMGEVHPALLSKFGIKTRVYCAEFSFYKISDAAKDEHIYQKPSKYPEVVRDIALLVPRKIMVEEVLNTIETVGGPLLRDTDLFDMYEGENLPDDKKNLAFHLLFQSDERTLKSQEVDEIMVKITKVLEEKRWEVR